MHAIPPPVVQRFRLIGSVGTKRKRFAETKRKLKGFFGGGGGVGPSFFFGKTKHWAKNNPNPRKHNIFLGICFGIKFNTAWCNIMFRMGHTVGLIGLCSLPMTKGFCLSGPVLLQGQTRAPKMENLEGVWISWLKIRYVLILFCFILQLPTPPGFFAPWIFQILFFFAKLEETALDASMFSTYGAHSSHISSLPYL